MKGVADNANNQLDLGGCVAGGGGGVALAEREAGSDSGRPVIRSDPVVVSLDTGLTGASDEGTCAAAFGTRTGTTSDDGHRAGSVTTGEQVRIVDVAIVISPVVATLELVVTSAREPEHVVVAKGTVLEKVSDF